MKNLLIEILYVLVWTAMEIFLVPFVFAVAIGGLAIVAILAAVALIGLPGFLLYILSDYLLNKIKYKENGN
jgi:hypothetical protein